MASIQKAAALAGRRLNRKLEDRMKELWQDPSFRRTLDDETAKVSKKNFRAYVKRAIKRSEAESGN